MDGGALYCVLLLYIRYWDELGRQLSPARGASLTCTSSLVGGYSEATVTLHPYHYHYYMKTITKIITLSIVQTASHKIVDT